MTVCSICGGSHESVRCHMPFPCALMQIIHAHFIEHRDKKSPIKRTERNVRKEIWQEMANIVKDLKDRYIKQLRRERDSSRP